MKRKLISKSAFFNPRFLTGLGLCSIGVFLALLVFARPNQSVEQQNQSLGQQSIPIFVGIKSPQPAGVPAIGSIENMEGDYLIDLAALDIHPAAGPLPLRALSSGDAGSPQGAAMRTGGAFMGITQEVVNQSIATGAFGILSSGWVPAETVRLYFNGVLAATFAANADGVVAVNVGTGAGFGLLTA